MRARNFLIMLLAAGFAAVAAGEARAQQIPIPDGYTAYKVEGEGINAPPLPFKIEGDKFVAPEGGMVAVIDSRVTEDRLWMTLAVPGAGDIEYIGHRDGASFTGYMFQVSDTDRDILPVKIYPADGPAPDDPTFAIMATSSEISRVDVVPGDAHLRAGERRRFVARAYDADGNEIADPEVEWYGSGPRTRMSDEGVFYGLSEGTKQVVAEVGGVFGSVDVEVAAPEIRSFAVYSDVPARMAAGSRLTLDMDGLDSVNRWVLDPTVEINSSSSVVTVDGMTLTAVQPGNTTIAVTSGETQITYEIEVVAATGDLGITGAPEDAIRTGDVVNLSTTIGGAYPIWTVVGAGASVFDNGDFVADRPGTYTVLATLGDRTATTSIEAVSRGKSGQIHMNGHGLNLEANTSDLWPQNNYVYVGTHQANTLLTFDVSDPANPILTDEQEFDARVVNDVKVSEDGQWLVATREGAADRRNGILVLSLDDPAKPQLVAEYTETLTAGVHNVFWVGTLVYAVNDGTGDLHIIDLADAANPVEVGRWGLDVDGRSLHDIWVQDGVAYLSYLSDGLVILDVGGAGYGGTPTEPVQVSRIFYPGGPTHTAMRYGDYVFVGDEDFSLQGTVPSVIGSDPRGPIHVIDVRDLAHPKYAARYEVPEAGAHNIWIADGTLYIGYYQGGIRAVDISGELRGELYDQGREIAYFLPTAGTDEAKTPFSTRTWGVFPMFTNGWATEGDVLYATDYNSGLWTFTVEIPEDEIS